MLWSAENNARNEAWADEHGGRAAHPEFYGGRPKKRREPRPPRSSGGTMNSTSFQDKPQRDDPTVTNTYFNSGKEDGAAHGHVKHKDNPDGTTDYLYARDVEGSEYDVD